MKGLSTFVAAVMLIAFTVAVGGILALFLTGFFRVTTSSVGTQGTQGIACAGAAIAIDSLSCATDPSLVGYWRFEEGSGSTASDSSGNGNTGTLENSPTWTAGKYGNALQFSGVNNGTLSGTYVLLNPATLGSLNGTNQLTIVAWIYPLSNSNNPADMPIVSTYSNGRGGFSFNLNNQDPMFAASNFSWYDDTYGTFISYNQWTQVAATYTNGNVAIYENGTQVVTSSGNRQIQMSNNSLSIGLDRYGYNAPLGDYYFNGTIDDLRIYNRALSPTEIQNLYQNGIALRASIENYGQVDLGKNFTVSYQTGSGTVQNYLYNLSTDLTAQSVASVILPNLNASGTVNLFKVSAYACNEGATATSSQLSGVYC